MRESRMTMQPLCRPSPQLGYQCRYSPHHHHPQSEYRYLGSVRPYHEAPVLSPCLWPGNGTLLSHSLITLLRRQG
ncbi:hypothetical protein BGZ61DRAFT_448006 [Ilyonectria robusta]|uniref:uncharacterized protein n=1 Tax=Ilyonectria robusta TaxID=1079257 RepID=UPI001E8DD689|nr:uncharacterized protein BGZ61DRAFT_448006 [Ilyonectria robusta]KAH8722109.1 hypothetical protein BGZ61DRAFT_448006 [Ilyonectria robusta]